ncbi:hypothetical protein L2Y90_08985 [Burkholderia pyrrocinia]|uniref:hypothetical protein n=1 Tax=Burkholderia pyrrocinia TaxID=60550 RepID=UPI00215B31A6|nr:hypothetical protein [Burkholderia pyrrocinia]UVE64000.1 hypothetical protein L2Y90_08985 [Burkholderia pyrrocinia]
MAQLPEHLLPVVLLRRNGSACVLLGWRIDDSGNVDSLNYFQFYLDSYEKWQNREQ